MKIACLGNMNNNLFQIGRYLIDKSYDVTFFLFDEFEHFLPEADSYTEISNYKIKNLGWNFDLFHELTPQKIKQAISGYDLYIGTDLAPAFLFKTGLKLDIFVPHGSELYEYPFLEYKNRPPQQWEIIPYIVGKFQFQGIKLANYISLDPSEEVYETPCKRIRGDNSNRIAAPPFLYLEQYKNANYNNIELRSLFSKLREKWKFIAFQHGSQDWSNRGPYKINKGNDVLINAFAGYLKEKEFSNDSLLILVEYGGDVEKSKELIKKLNIENNVKWLPKMNRKDIMLTISNCDICIGELGYRNWFSYSCIYEFMAMKKPLIHHRNDGYYKNLGLELYPMVDARTVNEVKETFLDYRVNPGRYVEMGKAAYEWLEKRTQSSINEFVEVIEKKCTQRIVTNQIENFWLHNIKINLDPDIVHSYFLLKYIRLKEAIKKFFSAKPATV